MFVIRREQMKILSDYMTREFQKTMATHLRKKYPVQTLSLNDAELLKWISDATAKAGSYGIVSEEDVGAYLEYSMRFGKQFTEDPNYAWAGAILRQADIDGSRKMRRLANKFQKIDEGFA